MKKKSAKGFQTEETAARASLAFTGRQSQNPEHGIENFAC